MKTTTTRQGVWSDPRYDDDVAPRISEEDTTNFESVARVSPARTTRTRLWLPGYDGVVTWADEARTTRIRRRGGEG